MFITIILQKWCKIFVIAIALKGSNLKNKAISKLIFNLVVLRFVYAFTLIIMVGILLSANYRLVWFLCLNGLSTFVVI